MNFTRGAFSGRLKHFLAYGWRAGNLNWPISIQRAGKILVSWRQINMSGKALKSSLFSHWKLHEICTKRDLQFQKPYQIVKSEKYEKFCASKLLIWRQKWAADVRHGTSLVVRRVSSGRPIVVLFWTKYAFPPQIQPGILKITTSRGHRTYSLSLVLLIAKRKAIIVSFR